MKHKLLLLLALTLGLASNVWALDKDANDVYQIGTAQDLLDFAKGVSDGTIATNANAVLTIDINLSEVLSETVKWTPIGNSSNAYTGTFDGQGYTISGFSYSSSGYGGLFGCTSNATIKNFSIRGSLTHTENKYSGVIGNAQASTISNIHSFLTINATSGDHVGGVVGSAESATGTTISGCSFGGSITTSTSGNYGGIVGYVSQDNVLNCANYGSVSYSNKSCSAGGIVGYVNNASVSIQNCLNKGSVSYTGSNSPSYGGAIIGRHRKSASNVKNNYWLASSATKSSGGDILLSSPAATSVTADQLTSGEVCYALNGDQSTIAWYQTLPATPSGDATPTLDRTHRQVYVNGTTCPDTGNLQEGTVSYSNAEGTSEGVHNYSDVTGLCTYCSYPNAEFMTLEDGYYEISSKEQLVWFAAFVNAGNYNVNAKLTIDIDMDEADISYFPIGTQAHPYTGTFDGQGHKISNLQLINASAPTSYGMFNTGANVFLKNFWLDENCAIQGTEEVGLIGRHAGGEGRFEGLGNCGNVTGSKRRDGGIIGAAWGENETITIKNCWTTGTITGGAINAGGAAAIIAWFNSATMVMENCWTIADVTGVTSQDKYVYDNGTTNTSSSTFTNCYSKNGSQSTFSNTISDGQLTSGELCYLLNGSTSGGTNWYQTLGTDGNPYPYTTHGVVYRNGVFCPDTGEPQGTFSYGNDDEGSIGSHNYVDGICSYCNFVKSDYMTPVDGYYMIGTPAQLKWFAAYVNAGHPAVNAKLTNITPIDLTGITMQPIGNASVQYTGTFDGQGRSITNFTTEPCRYNGLFGYINGATVKNFSISGTNAGIETLTTGDTNCIGVIGQSVSTSKISGIHSSLNITVRCASDAGGILGSGGSASGTDKLTISNCSYSGTLTVNDGVATDQFGGIVGYTAAATIKNCLFAGIVNGSASGRGFGGILGYTNYYIKGIQNCLSVGTISGTGGRYGHIIGNYPSTNDLTSVVFNNYYPSGAVAGAGNHADKVGTIAKSVEELASGEVCYLLNGNQSEINWYQTIGTDDYPTLDSSSEQVRFVGTAGYTTFYDEDNDWELLGDAKAYIGTINGSALHLDEIGDIPHDKAVVIGGTYYNRVSTTATADTDGNALLGSKGTIEGDGVNIYALAKKNDVVGFYPVADGVTIPAGKAYLNLSGSLVREFFTFVFDDDDATGINSPLLTSPEEEGQVYNLAGQRISKLQKGINIINGKKVLK